MDYIGQTIHVFWKDDNEWYTGIIDDYHPTRGYHIQYNDGDDEWMKSLKGAKIDGMEGDPDFESNDYYYDDNHDVEDAEGGDDMEDEGGDNMEDEGDEQNYGDTGLQTIREQSDEDDADHTVNSEFSSAELSENGLLLKGEITGANNLPLLPSAAQGDGVFYRVLYAEGGNQSSMFRCKTPIYKSSLSSDMEFPQWSDGPFRFEMVMPGDTDRSDFTEHGDIIVALYQARSNGGSDFIGQVSIELQDFIRVGSVGRPRPGAECRFLRGAYVLLDRHGEVIGEGADVDLNIKLEWKLKTSKNKVTTEVQKRGVATANPSARSGTLNGKRGQGKKTSSGAVNRKSTNHSTGKISASGIATMSTATALQRNKKQQLVDRQNQLLKERIMKAGPKRTSAVEPDLYKPTALSNSRSSNKARVGAAGPAPAASGKAREDRTVTSAVSGLSKKNYKDLLVLYDLLRTDIGNAEKELFAIRTRVNKKKIQVSKDDTMRVVKGM